MNYNYLLFSLRVFWRSFIFVFLINGILEFYGDHESIYNAFMISFFGGLLILPIYAVIYFSYYIFLKFFSLVTFSIYPKKIASILMVEQILILLPFVYVYWVYGAILSLISALIMLGFFAHLIWREGVLGFID